MSLLSTSFPAATISFPSRNSLLPTLIDQLKTSTKKPLEHHHLVLHSPPPRLVLVRCSSQQRQQGQEFQFERLFSNLNKATLKREPGSLSSSIFLVAGTTVGAGILAIPAVTQEAGFLASAVACILCWIFMVVTGLLVAEVNVNTMCELGSGGVSLAIP